MINKMMIDFPRTKAESRQRYLEKKVLTKLSQYLCDEAEATLSARLLGKVRSFSCALQGWMYCSIGDFSIIKTLNKGLYGDLRTAILDAESIYDGPTYLIFQKFNGGTLFISHLKNLTFRIQPYMYVDEYIVCSFDKMLAHLNFARTER